MSPPDTAAVPTDEDKKNLQTEYHQLTESGGRPEIVEALLADAAGWAQHYSTVRMTVTTFLIGLAFGIVTAKWDDFRPALFGAVWTLWMLAFLFLVHFTQWEAEKLVNWRHNLNLIFANANRWKKVGSVPKSERKSLRKFVAKMGAVILRRGEEEEAKRVRLCSLVRSRN